MKSRARFSRRRGSADFVALIFIAAIVIIGSVVGLATIRNSVVQEFGDVGVGLVNLDQSYDVQIEINADDDPAIEFTYSASYEDLAESAFGDPDPITDPAGLAPACLVMNVPAGDE